MRHYRSDRGHAEFLLFEVLADEVAASGLYDDFDRATTSDLLAHVEEFAHQRLADSFASADRDGLRFDPQTGEVQLPDDLRQALRAHLESDWLKMDLPRTFTDAHVPPSLRWAATEFILGANPPVAMCTQIVPQVVRLLVEQGTAEQQRLAELIVERGWTVTMVLTEPEAGSDLAAARTRAIPQDDGTWHLEGSKRFITWAAHDATENVVHAVLARPQIAGVPEGTRGLSLFLVPEHTFDPRTGELTGRNGAFVAGLEKKMGIRGAPTCELVLGDRSPAVGSLVGDRHDGLRQMFEILTYFRMMVGAKAAAALSTGFLNARDYAEERVQGRQLISFAEAGERVGIIDHPDVRRSLLSQRGYAEGSRALVLYTATLMDRIEAAAARGELDPAARERHRLLLPVVKGWCSETAFRVLATESLQTLGGPGYTQDHPLEQYVRDTKIDTIYEGTTGIQALDLLTRRVLRDRGTVLESLLEEIGATAKAVDTRSDLRLEAGLLADATQRLREYVGWALDNADERARTVALGANTLLRMVGDLTVGWLLLRSAAVASDQPGTGTSQTDSPACLEARRRVAAARWFVRQQLPRFDSDLAVARLLDPAVVETTAAQP